MVGVGSLQVAKVHKGPLLDNLSLEEELCKNWIRMGLETLETSFVGVKKGFGRISGGSHRGKSSEAGGSSAPVVDPVSPILTEVIRVRNRAGGVVDKVVPVFPSEKNTDGVIWENDNTHSMSSDDLIAFKRTYCLPPSLDVIVPGPGDKIYAPPKGAVCLSLKALEYGARVPFGPLISDFLCRTRLCPTQISRVAWTQITSWAVAMSMKSSPVPPSTDSVVSFFSYHQFMGSRTVVPVIHVKQKDSHAFRDSIPNKANNWHKKFLYFSYTPTSISPLTEVKFSFRVPRVWRRDLPNVAEVGSCHVPPPFPLWRPNEKWMAFSFIVESILSMAGVSCPMPPDVPDIYGCDDIDL